MNNIISPNKTKATTRLPHSILRGGFLSGVVVRITIPVFD
jgi:hypothetical protein